MNDQNLPATKKDLQTTADTLGAVFKKDLQTTADTLGAVFKKDLQTTADTLGAEIKITAEETKQELREEARKNTSRIINHMDAFLKEIRQSREEREIVSHKLSDHEGRIGKLEKRVFA